MRRTTIGCIVSLTLSVLSVPCLADAQQVVFLVRHGEQTSSGNGDSPLTEAGQRHARALATVLKEAGLTAIYVSEFQRTRQAAEPLAQALQIEPTRMPRGDVNGLLERLRARPRISRGHNHAHITAGAPGAGVDHTV